MSPEWSREAMRESQNTWSYPFKFFVAWVYQGCWHSWEWFVLALLWQQNGGVLAYQRAVVAGILADLIYTMGWFFTLLYYDREKLYMLVFFCVHAFVITLWFFSMLQKSIADKRSGAKWYFIYMLTYCTFFILGSAPFRGSWSPCFLRVGYALVGFLEVPILYWCLRLDSLFWRSLAAEITRTSTFKSMVRRSIFTSVLDIENVVSMEVPILDYTLFEDETLIGSGATAVVTKCQYKGEWVAVKCMVAQSLSVNEFVGMVREAFVTRRLAHPNLVLLKGIALVPPEFCIVYEFCSIGSFDKVFKFEWELRFKLLWDAVRGIQALHAEQICHRDLKLENILIHERRPGEFVAKVADFGTAKILESHRLLRKTTAVSYSASGFSRKRTTTVAKDQTTAIGTFVYLAPEVLQSLNFEEGQIEAGDKMIAYDLSVDIYSLGVIFWEVYYKQRAYQEDSRDIVALAKAITNEAFRPFIAPAPTQPEQEFLTLIESCWSPNSHHRPSVDQIAKAFAFLTDIQLDPKHVSPRNCRKKDWRHDTEMLDDEFERTMYNTLEQNSLTFNSPLRGSGNPHIAQYPPSVNSAAYSDNDSLLQHRDSEEENFRSWWDHNTPTFPDSPLQNLLN